MLRASAIVLLIAMGLITNQLPLLWLSYSTAQAEYAIENCESPDTSCQGSCTMDRDFSEGGQDPVTVIKTETNLFPYVVPHTNLCLVPYQEVILCTDRRTSMAPQFCAMPTPPPPRA